MWVITSLLFDNPTLINLYNSNYRKATRAMQTLKSSLTSCFKYFAIINFARETNAPAVGDLLQDFCIC